MDQRVRVRAAHRRPRRPARPSRPYPADEWRQLQAQSEQAPLTPFQLGHADGSSQPSLMPDEKLISSVGFLPTSLMYFCSGEPMPFCSGVDISFSFKLVSDQSLIGSGVASVRKKLPRL